MFPADLIYYVISGGLLLSRLKRGRSPQRTERLCSVSVLTNRPHESIRQTKPASCFSIFACVVFSLNTSLEFQLEVNASFTSVKRFEKSIEILYFAENPSATTSFFQREW